MPRIKGQTKLNSLPKPDSPENLNEIRRAAYGGDYEGTPQHEIMRECDSIPDSDQEFPMLSEEPRDEEEVKIAKLIASHGDVLGEKIRSRDAEFFRRLADCLDAFPEAIDGRPEIDRVLAGLYYYRTTNQENLEVKSRDLQDFLKREYALTPDLSEIRKKAEIIGLTIIPAQGRPRSNN